MAGPTVHLAHWRRDDATWLAVKVPYNQKFLDALHRLVTEKKYIQQAQLWLVEMKRTYSVRDLLVVNFVTGNVICQTCWTGKECSIWAQIHFQCAGLGVGGLESRIGVKETPPPPPPPRKPRTLDERVVLARELLGIQIGASDQDIKRAARKLAWRHHPDRGGSQEKMVEVFSARDLLLMGRR